VSLAGSVQTCRVTESSGGGIVSLEELSAGESAQRIALSSKLEQLEYEARKAFEQYDVVDAARVKGVPGVASTSEEVRRRGGLPQPVPRYASRGGTDCSGRRLACNRRRAIAPLRLNVDPAGCLGLSESADGGLLGSFRIGPWRRT